MLSLVNRNGNWIGYEHGEYRGMVSQNPPDTMNAGMWQVSLITKDGGLVSFGS